MGDPSRPAGAGIRFALAAALAFMVLLGIAVPVETWVAQGTAGAGPAALLGLWVPMVARQAAARGIAPVLALALIAHESGGDYLAVNVDPDGTVDAGLGQVNQVHWAEFGLAADPFDPGRNVAASLDLLRAAMDRYPRNLGAALGAYNGFGPGYAQAVLAAAAGIARRPALSVWPVAGRERGGVWLTPASDGRSAAFLLVTAYRAAGRSLVPPARLAATRDGRPLALAPAGAAPPPLKLLTPPQASFWWAAVALPPNGGRVRVTVTASWARQGRERAGSPRHGTPPRQAVRLTRVVELARTN